MIKFLIQLAITAGLGYYAGKLAYQNDLYYGPPADVIAFFVMPFLACQGVSRIAGPVPGRLVALAIVVACYKLVLVDHEGGSVLYFSATEQLAIGAAVLAAIFLPGGSAHRKLRTGASKAAIARGEEWAWEGMRFAVHVDFRAATVRLIGRGSMRVWRPGADGKLAAQPAKRFDQTFPLHQFSLGEVHQHTKSRFIPNVASGWSNGNLISVNLPGGSHVSAPTGVSDITFHHLGAFETACDYAGLKVATGGPESCKLVLFKVPNREVQRFQAQWTSVAERAGAAYTAFNDAVRKRGQQLRAEERAHRQAEAAQAQAAEQERLAALRSQAEAATRALLREAGMAGDFHAGMDTEGRVDWYIAADRDGRGLVAAGGDVWQGNFAGARARILHGKERGLELELPDSEYESAHLKKRRMCIMQATADGLIQEWSDRVGILAARQA